jgi:hypothetical protein
MQITMTMMIMRQHARRPALRWYSDAVVSSSAADAVWFAVWVTFDSMLS